MANLPSFGGRQMSLDLATARSGECSSSVVDWHPVANTSRMKMNLIEYVPGI